MITVSYRIEGDTLTLRVKGHAGSAPAGQDLLCAAVTALSYTLAQAVTDAADKLENEPMIELREGFAKVSSKPLEAYRPGVMVMYQTILSGFQMLSGNYPGQIKVITHGTPCET